MAVTIDGTAFELPGDEFVGSKVVSYNSLLTALETAWTTYAPTWTNLTIGNGTVTALYRRIGKLVIVRVSIVFGSTTSVSGSVRFTLPVTRAAYAGTAGLTPIGLARMLDASVPVAREGMITSETTTTGTVIVYDASGTYLTGAALSSTVPFTWTTGDEINCSLQYEAA